jgi:hypothetical protein
MRIVDTCIPGTCVQGMCAPNAHRPSVLAEVRCKCVVAPKGCPQRAGMICSPSLLVGGKVAKAALAQNCMAKRYMTRLSQYNYSSTYVLFCQIDTSTRDWRCERADQRSNCHFSKILLYLCKTLVHKYFSPPELNLLKKPIYAPKPHVSSNLPLHS